MASPCLPCRAQVHQGTPGPALTPVPLPAFQACALSVLGEGEEQAVGSMGINVHRHVARGWVSFSV